MYYWVYLILSVIGIFCGIIFLLKETNRSKSFFRENVRDFASLSRKTKKNGRGVSIRDIQRKILKNHSFLQRKKAKRNLFEFEKILFENNYIFKRHLKGRDYRSMRILPHIDNIPRVVLIADYFLLKFANFRESDLRGYLKEFVEIASLTFDELLSLKKAFAYSILKQILRYIQRSSHFERTYLKAKGKFIKKYRNCDSYIHFYFQNNKTSTKKITNHDLEKSGRNFYFTLESCKEKLEKLIFLLQNLNEIFSNNLLLELSEINQRFESLPEYSSLSSEVKIQYLRAVNGLSKKTSLDEFRIAEKAISMAERRNEPIATVLFLSARSFLRIEKGKDRIDIKYAKMKEIAYIYFTIALATLISFIPLGFKIDIPNIIAIPLLLLATIPLCELLIKKMLSHCVTQKPVMEMNYKNIPNEGRTIVVVSSFYHSFEEFKSLYNSCCALSKNLVDDNVFYAILLDFPDSTKISLEQEKETLNMIDEFANKERIYCRHVSLFIRKRIKEGNVYRAWERKRGGILTLFKALISGNYKRFSRFEKIRGVNLAILLDEDSKLMPGDVKKSINVALHPANKKTIIFSYQNRINGFSLKSNYAKRFQESSYTEIYPYGTEFYYKAFGKGIFCGKAIVRVKEFFEGLKDSFPDKSLLSHDVIEGAVLSTASIDVAVYEDAPISFIAEDSRRKRWNDGDLMLLPYLGRQVKNRKGEKVKNNISPIYKFTIFVNCLQILSPFMYLLVLFLCAIFIDYLIPLFMLFLLLIPARYEVFSSIFDVVKGVKASVVLKKVFKSICRGIDDLLMLPYFGVSGITTFIKKLLFDKVRKKTIRWNTFKSQNGLSALSIKLKQFLPTVFVSLFLVLFSRNQLFGIYIIFSLFYTLYKIIGKGIKERRYKGNEELGIYLAKTYLYFKENLSPIYLIADNVQIFPEAEKHGMTSPTDIGFSLLAFMIAYKEGLDDKDFCLKQIKNILKTVEALPKYLGNLYNWYNVDAGSVMLPKIISSVDSGNYCACLITLCEFLKEIDDFDTYMLAKSLLDNTNLRFLLNKKKNLFHISYDEDQNCFFGHYDNFASESRILYFVYASLYGDIVPYFSVNREYSPIKGNTPLSWSGSAFEYMLPNVFFNSPSGFLADVMQGKISKIQKEKSINKIWGVSESGYFSFDDAGRYKYKAHGLSLLSLDSNSIQTVIAPYASFLCLDYQQTEVRKNCLELISLGMLGKYGFYEAYDLIKGKKVQSFMAHHQGMIMASIYNFTREQNLRKYFINSPLGENGSLILCEKVSEMREHLSKKSHTQRVSIDNFKHKSNCLDISCHAISKNGYTIFADSVGHIFSCCGFCITPKIERYNSNYSQKIVVRDDKGKETNLLDWVDNQLYFSFQNDEIVFTKGEFEVGIKNTPYGKGELKRIVIENQGGEIKRYEILFYTDLVLNDYNSYISHKTFSDIFVECKIKNNYVKAQRRKKDCTKSNLTLFSAWGLDNLKINCNKRNVLEISGERVIIENVSKERYPVEGCVLYPCVCIKGEVLLYPKERKEIYVFTSVFDNEDEENEIIERHKKDYKNMAYSNIENQEYESFVCKQGRSVFGNLLAQIFYNSIDNFSKFYKDNLQTKEICFSENDLTILGIDKIKYFSKLLQSIDSQSQLVFLSEKNKFENWKSKFEGSNIKVFIQDEYDTSRIFTYLSSEDQVSIYPIKEKFTKKEIDKQIYGEGYFVDGNGYLVSPFDNITMLPYSNVIANESGGYLITSNGGGFSYGKNAREDRVSLWNNDPIYDLPSSRVYLYIDEDYYPINTVQNSICIFYPHKSIFKGKIKEVEYCLSVTLKEDGATLYNLDLQGVKDFFIVFNLIPSLGFRYSSFCAVESISNRKIVIKSLENNKKATIITSIDCSFFNSDKARFNLLGNNEQILDKNTNFIGFVMKYSCRQKTTVTFAVKSGEFCSEELNYYQSEEKQKEFYNSYNNLFISTDNFELDQLFNHSLIRQVLYSRFYGKTGFYQCSGAFGFRDQLQDVLAFLYSKPDMVKEHILLCAEHQYEEGDVMHWWHPPRLGVRTKISDDRVFFVYALCKYIKAFGDTEILSEKVAYLKSSPLSLQEHSRYEEPSISFSASIYEHAVKALKSVLYYGEHSLLLIKGGDWNDGLDRLGDSEKGESFWLTAFVKMVLADFIEFCSTRDRSYFLSHIARLKNGIENSFYHDRFIMAYAKDGTTLGSEESISILSQTFYTLSKGDDEAKRKISLETSKRAIDEKNKLIKLITPPFDLSQDYGYICAYPKGIRENGAQYTHGVTWLIKAYFENGNTEEGYELLNMINPLNICKTVEGTKRYQGEPYVLAGDVYSEGKYAGQCGWSWYTGSAGWYYRIILENLLGFSIRNGCIEISPSKPMILDSYRIQYKFEGTTYQITVLKGEEDKITENGIIVGNGKIRLRKNAGEVRVDVIIRK